MAVIEQPRPQRMTRRCKEIRGIQLALLQDSPEIFDGFKTVSTYFLENIMWKKAAIVETQHRQCTRLDHDDLSSLANVFQQQLAGALRLLLRSLNQPL